MKCDQCNAVLEKNEIICFRCGAKIENISQTIDPANSKLYTVNQPSENVPHVQITVDGIESSPFISMRKTDPIRIIFSGLMLFFIVVAITLATVIINFILNTYENDFNGTIRNFEDVLSLILILTIFFLLTLSPFYFLLLFMESSKYDELSDNNKNPVSKILKVSLRSTWKIIDSTGDEYVIFLKSNNNRIELQKKKLYNLVFANNEEEETIDESFDYSESEWEKIRNEKTHDLLGAFDLDKNLQLKVFYKGPKDGNLIIEAQKDIDEILLCSMGVVLLKLFMQQENNFD